MTSAHKELVPETLVDATHNSKSRNKQLLTQTLDLPQLVSKLLIVTDVDFDESVTKTALKRIARSRKRSLLLRRHSLPIRTPHPHPPPLQGGHARTEGGLLSILCDVSQLERERKNSSCC